MIKVLTFGVFDLLHYGHANLFKRAKAMGDYLIVAVQDDLNVIKNKPEAKLVNNLAKRIEDVRSIECVDQVIPYSQIDDSIKQIDFDILVAGPDQTNDHFMKAFDWCKSNNKRIIILPRTEGISSTMLRLKK